MTTEPHASGVTPWRFAIDATPEERRPLALAFLCAFAMFTAYAILRPVRETMGITSGVRNLPALFWATFAVMLAAQPLYGFIISRFPLRKALVWIYLAFAAMLIGFYAWFHAFSDHALVARVYFVWISVFNLFIVAVFWSLMADVFDKQQAGRLFGVIAGAISLGGLTGPALAAALTPAIGTINLLLVSAALLALSAGFMYRLIKARTPLSTSARGGNETDGRSLSEALGAFHQIAASPYLAGIALFVVCLTTASTLLYLEQQRIVAETLTGKDEQTVLFARIDFWVQAASLVAQLLVFRSLLARIGFTAMLACVPFVLVLAFAALAISPALGVIVAVMGLRRVGEYGFTRPARDMLFTVVAREEKYKAKNLIDTFVYRGGDALSASLYAGLVALAGSAHSGWVAGVTGMAVCSVWFALALWLGRHFAQRGNASPISQPLTSHP